MKKKLLSLIVSLICLFSFSVLAEDNVKLIIKSGDGTKLGDEVCIGDQCFYVIENDGETAKLLSKYNLYNGWVYNDYVDIEQETTNYSERDEKCYSMWSGQPCWDYFTELTGLTQDDVFYRDYSTIQKDGKSYFRVYYYTFLDNDVFKQTSEAIGLHGGDENNRTPEFPEVGVFNIFNSNISSWQAYTLHNDQETQYVKDGEIYLDSLQDFNFNEDIYYYVGDVYEPEDQFAVLGGYQDYLNTQGLSIKDINILSLTDINGIAKRATGNDLPLDEWVDGKERFNNEAGHNDYFLYGSLKDELGDDYSWLWGTTYWLRTFDVSTTYRGYGILFVESIGNICSDAGCTGLVGAGVRPVITVDSKDIVQPKQDIIVNPETGSIVIVAILGIAGLLIATRKTKKRMN